VELKEEEEALPVDIKTEEKIAMAWARTYKTNTSSMSQTKCKP
jgi:hypothetical protein